LVACTRGGVLVDYGDHAAALGTGLTHLPHIYTCILILDINLLQFSLLVDLVDVRDRVLLVLLAWVEEFDLIFGYGDFAQLWVDLEGFGVALLGLDVHWILRLILNRGLVGEFASFVVHHFFLEAKGRLPVLGAVVAAVVG